MMMSPLHTGTLSFVTLFSLLSIAAAVLFIVYAVEWNDHGTKINSSGDYQNEDVCTDQVKTEFSYYAAVIVLLFVISGMHGFAIMKELL